MPSFNKDPKIKTQDDPGTDHKLPSPGPQIPLNVIQLRKQIIEYVDGDIMRTVTGNVAYEVRQDLTTKILGEEHRTVEKKQTLEMNDDVEQTIGKDLNFTVHGTENSMNIGPQNLTLIGAQTETKTGAEQKEDGTSAFEVKPTDMAMVYGFEFALNTALKIDIGILGLELGAIKLALAGIDSGAKVAHATSELLEAKMQALTNRICGVRAEAGGAEVAAIPKVNAAPEANTDPPLG